MLLISIWLNPVLFQAPKDVFMQKIEHLSILFAGIGLPFIDDEIRKTCEAYYDVVNN